MTCIRCHKKPALSDQRRAMLSRDVGCDVPGDLCYQCIVEDPAYHHAIISWAVRKREETIQTLRNAIARPLEAIDRWVDSLRG